MALKLWGFESPPPHHDNGSEERSISSGIDRCFVAIRKDRVVLFDCLGISLPGFRDSHFAVSEDAGTRTSPQRMHHYHVSRLAGGYRRHVSAPALLIEPLSEAQSCGVYSLEGYGTQVKCEFPMFKLYEEDKEALKVSDNPSSGRTRRDSGRGRAETASRRTASPTRPSPTAPNVKNNALRPNDFPRAFLSLPLLLPKALHPSHYKNPLSATQNPAAPFRLRDAPPRIRKPIMDAAPRTEQPRKRVHSQNG